MNAPTTAKSKGKLRTVYCLRIRGDDQELWGQPTRYFSRKERNNDEKMCRIIGGMRTHSYDERRQVDDVPEVE